MSFGSLPRRAQLLGPVPRGITIQYVRDYPLAPPAVNWRSRCSTTVRRATHIRTT